MRIKRREIMMLGVLVAMCLMTWTLFRLTQIPKPTTRLQKENVTIAPAQPELTKEKEEKIYDYVEEKIAENAIRGITILENQRGLIETDGYKRYYAEINSVGINNREEIGIYTYCIVIQENDKGEFYIMPYGFELINAEMDSLKKDIVSSTMKVVNQWGVDLEKGNKQEACKGQPIKQDFETLFSIQKMSKLIVEFLESYSQALLSKEFEQIESYFKKDTPYFRKQEREFNNLVESAFYCDLRDVKILNIASNTQENSFFVTIEGDIYTYLEEGIMMQDFNKIYKVIFENDKVMIVGEVVKH